MTTPFVDINLSKIREQYRAFLFDCDGTLVDSMGLHHQAWVATLKAAGACEDLCPERFYSLGGMSGTEVARTLVTWTGVGASPQELTQAKRQRYFDLLPQVKEINAVADFARLVSETHPIAVVSGGHRAAVDLSLNQTGLAPLFEVIVTPENVANGKPAPDMYLLAAERLGIQPAECLVFEDGIPGVHAAEAAGMDVVLVDATPPVSAS